MTKSEVLEARKNSVTGGCCNRFADNMVCDCLERAEEDLPTKTCPTCKGDKHHPMAPHPRTEESSKRFPCPQCEGRGSIFLSGGDKGGKLEEVNHPAHYGGEDNPYEAIKVIEALGWLKGFCLGNAYKYLARAGNKPGTLELTDLQKAEWYLNYWISKAKEP